MVIADQLIQNNTTLNKQVFNYKMLDVIKYVSAIMVICIHCEQLFPQEYLNFFIKNIICRVAVPFFFISSAYFVRKGSIGNANYVNIYLKRLMKSYCLWSVVFIPIGLDWIHQNLSLAGYLLPFALIYGLIHIGTYYHLWYVPAMILAIFLVNKLLKRFSYKTIFIVAIALFMFGSIESYYGLLQNGWFKEIFNLLIKVIFTTRSGLLYGMIFTLIGFYIYDYQSTLISLLKYLPILTVISLILLIMEGSFLYGIDRLDMNFLIMLVPFSFFFFLWMLVFPYHLKYETKKIRKLSKYYYFVHPVSIVIVEEINRVLGFYILSSGIISLMFIVFLTHLLSSMIIKIKWPLKTSYLVFATFYGIMITSVLASIFFYFKLDGMIVKFELVPCIWLYSSFVVYYILMKRFNKNSTTLIDSDT